jgi:hypothetical protein
LTLKPRPSRAESLLVKPLALKAGARVSVVQWLERNPFAIDTRVRLPSEIPPKTEGIGLKAKRTSRLHG